MARRPDSSDILKNEKEFGFAPDSPPSPPPNKSGSSPFSDVFSSEYEKVKLDDSEDVTASGGDNSRPSVEGSVNSLGIFPDRQARVASVHKVPVESKSPDISSPSAAASPDSTSRLLDSPLTGFGGSPKAATWAAGPGATGIFERIWPWKRGETQLHGLATPDNPFEAEKKGSSSSLSPDTEMGDEGITNEEFHNMYSEPPTYCSSRKEVRQNRSKMMIAVALYSTLMSGVWLWASIQQPRWGDKISSKSNLIPSTATTLAVVLSKSIEISSLAVFGWTAGQIFTRRAHRKKSKGLTLVDISMRGWIQEPGAWFKNICLLFYGGANFAPRTAIMFIASLSVALYLPASDALVSPKLKFSAWQAKKMSGPVSASYGNINYAKAICPAMFGGTPGALVNDDACISVNFCGQSYRNLLAFMDTWTSRFRNGTSRATEMAGRPAGTGLLNGNVTMEAAWIETEHSNVPMVSKRYGRIINNVTMAMPHPGVFKAAKLKMNAILQPDELSGVGEYAIKAGVVSPSINVMCASVGEEELAPLVYTTWPNANTTKSGFGDQLIPANWGWQAAVPNLLMSTGEPEYYNTTVLDDVFKWGPGYDRRRPAFAAFPNPYNIISNGTMSFHDAIYMLAKHPDSKKNFTLCETRSWVSPNCSTGFNVSGTNGAKLFVECENANNQDAYHKSYPKDQQWPGPSTDWMWVANMWHMSMDMNGGLKNSNASNGRILSKTILNEPKLQELVPSMAEVLAVYLGSTLVLGSIDTPFHHSWDYKIQGNILPDPTLQKFNASLTTQEYTSGHIKRWQRMWYPVLGAVCFINFLCLVYAACFHSVTDFTEPKNLFTLALNSPPSAQIKGSCGAGPKKRDFVVPWRIAYAKDANHYFFQEANERPWKGRYSKTGDKADGDKPNFQGAGYQRLSGSRFWL